MTEPYKLQYIWIQKNTYIHRYIYFLVWYNIIFIQNNLITSITFYLTSYGFLTLGKSKQSIQNWQFVKLCPRVKVVLEDEISIRQEPSLRTTCLKYHPFSQLHFNGDTYFHSQFNIYSSTLFCICLTLLGLFGSLSLRRCQN